MAEMRVYEFGSAGCPYCQEQKERKVMEQVAKLFPGVLFQRVDSDVRDDLNVKFNIGALPTYIAASYVPLFGKSLVREISRLEGAATPEQLQDMVTRAKRFVF